MWKDLRKERCFSEHWISQHVATVSLSLGPWVRSVSVCWIQAEVTAGRKVLFAAGASVRGASCLSLSLYLSFSLSASLVL